MKCQGKAPHPLVWQSRPARGAWIEISVTGACPMSWSSRPARGAWIEISSARLRRPIPRSRPARGAWIEIVTILIPKTDNAVAPRTGRVD